ncbi:hypothetical protein BLOT_000890, partial [Blomia tropicalis]
ISIDVIWNRSIIQLDCQMTILLSLKIFLIDKIKLTRGAERWSVGNDWWQRGYHSFDQAYGGVSLLLWKEGEQN